MRRSLNEATPRCAPIVSVPVSVASPGLLPRARVTVPVKSVSVTPVLSWAATFTAGSMVTPADTALGTTRKMTWVAGPPPLEPAPVSAPARTMRAPSGQPIVATRHTASHRRCRRMGTLRSDLSPETGLGGGASHARRPSLQVLPRRRQHLPLHLGERSLEGDAGGLGVASPPGAEAVGEIRRVHIPHRAERHLDAAARYLPEQQGQSHARDRARELHDPVEVIGRRAVPLERVGRDGDPRQ